MLEAQLSKLTSGVSLVNILSRLVFDFIKAKCFTKFAHCRRYRAVTTPSSLAIS